MVALINVLALLLLLWSRGKSVLDLWLMVAVSALLMETAIVALFIPGRFNVGFYATRMIPLVVSKVVLIVLLSETVILHARLSLANRKLQRERETKLTSAETVVAALAHEVRQPLSGMTSRAAAGKRFLDRAPPDIAAAKRLFDQITDAAFVQTKCSKISSACLEETGKNTNQWTSTCWRSKRCSFCAKNWTTTIS
jgi:signal transduction histidine kinase